MMCAIIQTCRINSQCCMVMVLLAVFVYLQLADINRSPVYNEEGRLASGAINLCSLDFMVFTVNPPLPRMCAAFPIVFSNASIPDLKTVGMPPTKRHEYASGKRFLLENPNSHRRYFKIGRVIVSIFILIGLLGIWMYCRSFSKIFSTSCATLMFLFSPYILGHGGCISPDVPAAAMGLVVIFVFWKWLKRPDSLEMFLSGACLGLAELCKFTLLVFYPLFVILWILYRIPDRKILSRTDWFAQAKQLCGLFLISVFVINCGYLFEGTFTLLKNFKFQTIAYRV